MKHTLNVSGGIRETAAGVSPDKASGINPDVCQSIFVRPKINGKIDIHSKFTKQRSI